MGLSKPMTDMLMATKLIAIDRVMLNLMVFTRGIREALQIGDFRDVVAHQCDIGCVNGNIVRAKATMCSLARLSRTSGNHIKRQPT